MVHNKEPRVVECPNFQFIGFPEHFCKTGLAPLHLSQKIGQSHGNIGFQHLSKYMKSTINKPKGSGLPWIPEQGISTALTESYCGLFNTFACHSAI